MNKLNEILEFWNKKVDDHEDIVSVKEMAREDICTLVEEVKRLQKGINDAFYSLGHEDVTDEHVVEQIRIHLVELIIN